MTTTLFNRAAAALALATAVGLPGAALAGTGLAVLHGFTGTPDGSHPWTGLTAGPDGNLYGLTSDGGQHRLGALYQLTPDGTGRWTYRLLYSVGGADAQGGPSGRPAIDANGHIYFTNQGDGLVGNGGIIELVPDGQGGWALGRTLLFNRTKQGGKGNGAAPNGVVLAADGFLYGTAHFGGEGNLGEGYGTVFRIDPASPLLKVQVLHRFQDEIDGSFPETEPYVAADGDVYGIVAYGGTHYVGLFYKLHRADGGWHKTNLYSFTNGVDGMNPHCPLARDAQGRFYTCGSVAEGTRIDHTNVVQLSRAGKTWGATTIYQTLIYGTDPYSFQSVLPMKDGTLLVSASEGGPTDSGAIVDLSPNGDGTWNPSDLYDFSGGDDGRGPLGTLLVGPRQDLYGVTYEGGAAGEGTVFRLRR